MRNAILHRAFHQRCSISSGDRQHVTRERDAALARLDHLVKHCALLDVTLDMDAAIRHAANLSTANTERLGARAIDLLHMASALTLESELFLTTDTRQAQLAKSEGLQVVSVG
ncbi:MAG TPA: hypothetical protein VGK40_08950 [Verrucomicrobiae bacterium]